MPTFKVSPEELTAFGGRMYTTASGLFGAADGGYPAAGSGSSDLDNAVSGFGSHWGNTLRVMAQDLAELADKVTAAGKAYSSTESEIQKSAGGGGGGGGGW